MIIDDVQQICAQVLPQAIDLSLKYWGKVENIGKKVDLHNASERDAARLEAKTIIDEQVQELFLTALIDHSLQDSTSIDVEEKTPSIRSFNKNAKFSLVIDPIDGTKEYVEGREDFSINIALVSDKKIEFSFVAFPALDVIFSNSQSQEYTMESISEEGDNKIEKRFALNSRNKGKQPQLIKYNRRASEDLLDKLKDDGISVEPSNGLYFPILDMLQGKCDAVVAGTPQFRDIILHEILIGIYPNDLEAYDYDGEKVRWNTRQSFQTYIFARKGFRDYLSSLSMRK